MNTADVWAVVPIKETAHAKQRLGDAVPAGLKPRLALAMAEDVLAVLAAAPGLRGVAVVTIDAAASELARRYGARVLAEGAGAGQTGAVVPPNGRLQKLTAETSARQLRVLPLCTRPFDAGRSFRFGAGRCCGGVLRARYCNSSIRTR